MSILLEGEFWVAVGFVCVILILLKLHVPRTIAALLDKRAAAIASELDEAKKLREEAAQLLDSYKQKTANVDAEAAQILADAKTQAEQYAVEARAQLKAQIERRAKMAQDKIAMAEAQAVSEIRAQAADAATAAATKLITEKMTEAHAASLIKDSIKILPEKLN